MAASAQDTHKQYENYVALTLPVTQDAIVPEESGLLQLLGNVRELTSSVMPNDPNQLVTKGAYWANHPQYIDLKSYLTIPRDASNWTLGFRCARSQFDTAPKTEE